MNDTAQPAPAQPDTTGDQAYAATLARLIADPHATEVYSLTRSACAWSPKS